MDNRAYTQFENPNNVPPPAHYGTTLPNPTVTANDGKQMKKWKNSKRLCWALLILSLITVLLEIIGSIISGVNLDWLLGRFVAGVWLAVLGVIGASIGLRAFRDSDQSSKCWTVSHFVMCIISTVAYAILLLMAIVDIIGARYAIEDYYSFMGDDASDLTTPDPDDELTNSTTPTSANVTTTEIQDDRTLLNAVKGDLAISVLLVGTTIAFFIISIAANIIICRNWCRGKDKSMTIVYMPNDQSGNAQTQSISVPAKTKVIVVPAVKTDTSAQQHQQQTHLDRYNGI